MIVFMGVAGSGKSIQGRLLADALGYQWISSGELLRQHNNGKRHKEMLKGKLLKDQEIIDILKVSLNSMTPEKGCVLDGFPRTIPQAKWLIDQQEVNSLHIDAVFNLKASLEVVKKRLQKRGRQDDMEQAIKNRLDDYEKSTLPIVKFFKEEDIPTFDIDAEGTIEGIHSAIMGLVNTKG